MSQSCQNAFILQSLGLGGAQDAHDTQRETKERDALMQRPPPELPEALTAPEFDELKLLSNRWNHKVPEQYDEDGNETYEWGWYQSVQRLWSRWQDIFERFSDAHLTDDTEIYLGRAKVPGDVPRYVPREQESMDEEELHRFAMEQALADTSGAPLSQQELETKMADIKEFLRLESTRRAMHGDENELEDVVDLGEPEQPPKPPPPPPRTPISTEAHADIGVELDIYRSVKREAIEQLLRSDTLGTSALPYDIPGLQTMLAA